MRRVIHRAVLGVALLSGCRGEAHPVEPLARAPTPAIAAPRPEATPRPVPKADPGESCSRGIECTSSRCVGQGCGADAGTCAPANQLCTRDRAQFC
ncbi:MAG: hypothetical protein KUG77_03015, partial [Nannocystaceae bacterium]|nr:hypothetical protein [Nannocystaceae bacterium]